MDFFFFFFFLSRGCFGAGGCIFQLTFEDFVKIFSNVL